MAKELMITKFIFRHLDYSSVTFNDGKSYALTINVQGLTLLVYSMKRGTYSRIKSPKRILIIKSFLTRASELANR